MINFKGLLSGIILSKDYILQVIRRNHYGGWRSTENGRQIKGKSIWKLFGIYDKDISSFYRFINI